MEILTALLSAVGTVGFPIAAAIAMGVFIYKIYKKSEQREDKLLIELTETRKVNAQAIETITRYADNLETITNDISEIKTDVTILASKMG